MRSPNNREYCPDLNCGPPCPKSGAVTTELTILVASFFTLKKIFFLHIIMLCSNTQNSIKIEDRLKYLFCNTA